MVQDVQKKMTSFCIKNKLSRNYEFLGGAIMSNLLLIVIIQLWQNYTIFNPIMNGFVLSLRESWNIP